MRSHRGVFEKKSELGLCDEFNQTDYKSESANLITSLRNIRGSLTLSEAKYKQAKTSEVKIKEVELVTLCDE